MASPPEVTWPRGIAALAARQFPGVLPSILAIAFGVLIGVALAYIAMGRAAPVPQRADLRGIWIERAGIKPEAHELLELLRRSDDEGLDRSRYLVAEIEEYLTGPADAAALARADEMLTEAYLAYSRDLRISQTPIKITYIDQELAPRPVDGHELLTSGQPVERLEQQQKLNPVYSELRDGLRWYRHRWSKLPQVRIPSGEPLGAGSSGERVALLRRRLGLPQGASFDEQLEEAVQFFQRVHGLEPTKVADAQTIAALNLGAAHYEQLIALNLDRVRGLPIDGRRFIIVNTAEARLRMIEGGREVDTMRAIVGKPDMATPDLAGLIRFAIVNPYWNVPPDLVQHSIAPQVLREGPAYLTERRLVLFSDWRDSAQRLDPSDVDWSGVAAGLQNVWIRQLPGGDNMMGAVKFMLPNRLGIYLHDTPHKADFALKDRWLSSGCVRVEDARRLALWIFQSDLLSLKHSIPEERIDVPQPVAVYMIYLTVIAEGGEVRFQKDVYNRDAALLASQAGQSKLGLISAVL